MLLRHLIWCALGAALLLGSLQTAVQRWQAVPIVLAAEAFEDQAAAPHPALVPARGHEHADGAAGHQHDDEAWMPADGAERVLWTWVANLLQAFSMALLVFVVMGLWVAKRGSSTGSMRLACTVAAAGWLSLHLWPALGLPAEVPGMQAGALHARQAWWVFAALSAALACAVLSVATSRWRWLAAVGLLALPVVVGAPHVAGDPLAAFSGEAHARLESLGRDFVWATHWVALSFWASMAPVAGLLFGRWIEPALLSALRSGGAALPPAMEATR